MWINLRLVVVGLELAGVEMLGRDLVAHPLGLLPDFPQRPPLHAALELTTGRDRGNHQNGSKCERLHRDLSQVHLGVYAVTFRLTHTWVGLA